jgi:MFS family permease
MQGLYNTHGDKLRFPPSKKAQFPGTARQGRCVTECGIRHRFTNQEYNPVIMLNKLFRQTAIPPEYRSNFKHLYLDIAWYGILSGSAINFLNIYAVRLGASALQVGLVGAMSAVVTLLLAIPAGRWLQTQNTGHAIFWSSVIYRAGFVVLIFLPWFLTEQEQVVAIIVLTFLMAIPLTPLSVGFNALFAEAVPERYRAHVAGTRNTMLAVTFMVASLVSGIILKQVSFPIGYQIVFGIGAFGAAMSSYHLYHIRPLQTDSPARLSQPEPDSLKNLLSPRNIFATLRLDIWKTNFKKVLIALGGFHLAQYLAIPLFPLYFINELKLNDDNIGVGTALFYLAMLIGSTQLRKFVHRIGNKNVTGWGVVGLAMYPLLLAQSSQAWQYYAISMLGGLTFSMINGAYANYMLEHIPASDRPSHLAWYNVILNAAILIGSLGGPAIANNIGLVNALILFAFFRLISGVYMLKWG